MKRRKKSLLEEEWHAKTRNDFLTESQKQNKMKNLSNDLRNATKKIDYLQKKVCKLMNEESVVIDEGVGESLTEILRESKLTPVQFNNSLTTMQIFTFKKFQRYAPAS